MLLEHRAQVVEGTPDLRRESGAFARQGDPGSGPVEEPGTEPRLEVADPHAHRRLRDADLLGCTREAPEAGTGLETAKPFERRQGTGHESV
jgi:hypothetical protein